MANPSNNAEAAAIEAAYRTHVEVLFRALITNLGDQAVSHQTDQQCLDKFTVGLNIAKRARQLALNVVGAALPRMAAASARKRRTVISRHRRGRSIKDKSRKRPR